MIHNWVLDSVIFKIFLGSIFDASGYESEKYLNMSLSKLLLPTPLTVKPTSSYRLKSTINELRACTLQQQYRNNRCNRSSNKDTVATGVGDETPPKQTTHTINSYIPTLQTLPDISHLNQYLPIVPIGRPTQSDEIQNNDLVMIFDPWCDRQYIDNILHKLPFYTRFIELPSILEEYNSKWKVMIESLNYDYDCLKL